MPLVRGSVPNLIGGVSQQPPSIRAINTASALWNAYPNPVTGLERRPRTSYVATVTPRGSIGSWTNDDGGAMHIIDDQGDLKGVVIVDGDIKVFDLDTGTEETVTVVGSAGNYLTDQAGFTGTYKFVTVADTTFVLNTTRTVTQTTGESEQPLSSRKSEADHTTLWLKQGPNGYNVRYAVYRNGTFITATTSSADNAASLTNNLEAGIVAYHTGTSSLYTAIGREESTIRIAKLNSSDVWELWDSQGNTFTESYNDQVDEFADLAPKDADKRIIRVRQSLESDEDDYYVQYRNAQYEETSAFGTARSLDPDTMPHVLVKTGAGTWEFKEHTWSNALVGDTDSNPDPTFVGKTISNMFIFRGRMCFLSDENIIMSRVGEYEQFYRTSCIQLLDEDRIDIAAGESRTSFLKHWAIFNDELYLFTDRSLLRLSFQQSLTPSDVAIIPVAEYVISTRVPPVLLDTNVLFVSDPGVNPSFCQVHEFKIDEIVGTKKAEIITDQVPQYIRNDVHTIVSSSTHRIIVAATNRLRRQLFVYNWFDSVRGRLQSAWHKWSLPFGVLSLSFANDALYMLCSENDAIFIVKLDPQLRTRPVVEEEDIILDGVIDSDSSEITYIGYNGSASFIGVPWGQSGGTINPNDVRVVIKPNNSGSLADLTVLTPGSITGSNFYSVPADLDNEDYVIGVVENFQWELSPIYMRDNQGTVVDDRNLTLRSVQIHYQSSANFDCTISYPDLSDFTLVAGANELYSRTPVDDNDLLYTGVFDLGVYGNSDQVTITITSNDNPWRQRFTSMDWTGFWKPTAQGSSGLNLE